MASTPPLEAQLREARIEWPQGANRHFIPNSSLEGLIVDPNVKLELKRMYPRKSERDISKYTRAICHQGKSCKGIYAVLVCTFGQPSNICDFIDDEITDNSLPFHRNDPKNRSYRLCERDHQKHCRASSHRRCAMQAMQSWSQGDLGNFDRDQWLVQAPVFRKFQHKIDYLVLEPNVVLPFTEDDESTDIIETGGFSDVWGVRIHPAHQNVYQIPDTSEPRLAVKRLLRSVSKEFRREFDMLSALTMKHHKHLVKLLACYKYKGRYHFLFPYANCNLREYWKWVKMPYWNQDTCLWVLDQMMGLASGLNIIHNFNPNVPLGTEDFNLGVTTTRLRSSAVRRLVVEGGEEKYGRHGDLKPENILWSNDLGSHRGAGTLQIADFGLGRFHRLQSGSKDDAKNVNGSATYIPPEITLGIPVSRAYDIWSLGCVLLEFVTWLLEGSRGLQDFTRARTQLAHDGVEDDTFYTILLTNNDHRRAEIRNGVSTWYNTLLQSRRCSDMVRDLLAVISHRMLNVDIAARYKSHELVLELNRIFTKAKSDPGYLLGRNISIPDISEGIKSPYDANTLPPDSSINLTNTPSILIDDSQL